MSSRDIGPALPPHMRKNYGDVEEDVTSSGRRIHDEGRSGSRKDERRRHRDRNDGRDRHRDYDRERRKDKVNEKDRSRRYVEGGRFGKAREGHKEKQRDGKVVRDKQDKLESSNSSRRSKRSKTDRTYNTDTEESSDDNSFPNHRLDPRNDSECSDVDPEEEDVREYSDQSSGSRYSSAIVRSPVRSSVIESTNTPRPVLPPHLSKPPSTSTNGSDSDASSSDTPSRVSNCIGAANPMHLGTSTEGSMIGPALPPHLLRARPTDEEICDSPVVQPALPDQLLRARPAHQEIHDTPAVGPALPPHMMKQMETDHQKIAADSCSPKTHSTISNQIGPGPPPHLMKAPVAMADGDTEQGFSIIGPALPPGLKAPSAVGPFLPPNMKIETSTAEYKKSDEDSSDEEVLGPLLPEELSRSGKNYMVQAQLERNAAAIKRRLEEKDQPGAGTSQREEWMLELPPEGSVDLGLGPRTFRARGAPEKGADRSMWTDTPADKARKEEEARLRFELGISSTEAVKKAAVSKELSKKDKCMESVVKKHKRSKESLLESHQKKLKDEKKKKEKAGVKQERRPFNRDTDLKANVFDDAQKKAIYKKARLLDSRFSSGESKYL